MSTGEGAPTPISAMARAASALAMLAPLWVGCGKKAPPTPPQPSEAADASLPATAEKEAQTWVGAGAPGPTELAMAIIDVSGGTVALELVCPGGHRDRLQLVRDPAGIGGTVRFTEIPAELCTVYFKGGAPAQFAPVQGGQALSCTLQSTTAVCR